MIEWGHAQRCYPGEVVSGDAYVLRPQGDRVLLAVIDGLGHGPKAAEPAQVAVSWLLNWDVADVVTTMTQLDAHLRGTRGAAVSLALIGGDGLVWLGVGNVSGVVRQSGSPSRREYLPTAGGIVGYRLPPLRPAYLPLAGGDLIALATDGVRYGFAETLDHGATPQANADTVLARYGHNADDALVLVTRYTDRNETE